MLPNLVSIQSNKMSIKNEALSIDKEYQPTSHNRHRLSRRHEVVERIKKPLVVALASLAMLGTLSEVHNFYKESQKTPIVKTEKKPKISPHLIEVQQLRIDQELKETEESRSLHQQIATSEKFNTKEITEIHQLQEASQRLLKFFDQRSRQEILKQNKEWLPTSQTISLLSEIDEGKYDDINKLATLFKTPELPSIDALKISGFEMMGLTNEQIHSWLNEILPPGYYRSLKAVEYENTYKDYIAITHYHPAEKAYSFHVSQIDSERDFKEGLLDQRVIDREYLENVFGHEASHSVDWDSNPMLSPAERIIFLDKVLQRLNSEGRYKSEYIEFALNSTWGLPENIFPVAKEYWAEIADKYLTGDVIKGGSEVLPEEDKKIIEWLMVHTSPDWLRKQGAERVAESSK